MNDLRTLAADLDSLAQSYSRRARANGPFHADNDYLIAQAARWDEASFQIRLAISAAKQRAHDLAAEVEEDEDPTAGFLVEAAWDRVR